VVKNDALGLFKKGTCFKRIGFVRCNKINRWNFLIWNQEAIEALEKAKSIENNEVIQNTLASVVAEKQKVIFQTYFLV